MLPIADPFTSHFTDPFRTAPQLFVSVIAVSSAYLLCTPRKMFGTLVAFLFDYDPFITDIVAILVTIPLLWLIIRFLSPYIIRLKYENQTILFLFCLLPMAYYVLKYAFTVYTSLLYTGGFIIADFLDSFIVFLYCILSIYVIDITGKKKKAERKICCLPQLPFSPEKKSASFPSCKGNPPFTAMI